MIDHDDYDVDFDVGNMRPDNAKKVMRQQYARGSGPKGGSAGGPRVERDAIGITLWLLDRFVILGTLAAIFGAALIVFLKPGKSEEEYQDMNDTQIMGDLALSWFEMVWQLLVVIALAWGIARFVRAVTGRV